MVLAELGNRITNALRTMSVSTVIDEEVLDAMLKDIGDTVSRHPELFADSICSWSFALCGCKCQACQPDEEEHQRSS